MRQGERACGDDNGDEVMHGFEVFAVSSIRCDRVIKIVESQSIICNAKEEEENEKYEMMANSVEFKRR